MSNVCFFQTADKLFFSTDSASTIVVDGLRYRYSDNQEKIMIVDGMLLAMCGYVEESEKITKEFLSFNNKTPETIRDIAKRLYISDYEDDELNFDILIGRMENGQVITYQLADYNDFEIVKFESDSQLSEGGKGKIVFGSIGYKTKETYEKANELAGLGLRIDEFFVQLYDHIACQEIGGYLAVYCLDQNGVNLIYKGKIKEPQIRRYWGDYINNPIACHNISADKITAGTIRGITISGGTIESDTTINVGTDVHIGANLYMNPNVWGSKIYLTDNATIHGDPMAHSILLDAEGGVWAGQQRLDQPQVAKFG